MPHRVFQVVTNANFHTRRLADHMRRTNFSANRAVLSQVGSAGVCTAIFFASDPSIVTFVAA
jgi:hypothetical protein